MRWRDHGSCSTGQAMLLTVIMTGGILFLVTSVAGILMFYQLQQVTDAGNSAAAIFAADATLEKALYDYYTSAAYVYDPATSCFTNPPCQGPELALGNGASGSSYLVVPPPGTPNAETIITAEGKGPGGRTVRLLQTTILASPH
jgi:Flp pilus assembly protein TadG